MDNHNQGIEFKLLNNLFVFKVQQTQSDPFGDAAKAVGEAIATASQTATGIGETVDAVGKSTARAVQPLIEQMTQGAGYTLSSISQNSALRFLTDNLGADWIRTLLGEADLEKIQKEVAKLQVDYPRESPSKLAHRLIVNKALSAGGLGLAANIVPPLAIAFLGLELATLLKMQAEMIYQIAAVYGLELSDPARRGEVLAIFSLALGSSGVFKGGLGIIELLPVIGAFYGATTDAATVYVLGNVAHRYYEAKMSA